MPSQNILLPLRPELAGIEPYGAPQLDVPVLLNVNENPYSPSDVVVNDIAKAVREAATGLNRYPDRDFFPLRQALADYLAQESKVQLQPKQIWAANGSNEVMLHLLQAYGGPGQTVLSFAPTYSMYPEYARDTFTNWVSGKREADFSLDLKHVQQLLAQHNPSVLLLASPNNPTGTSLSPTDLRQICELALNNGPLASDGTRCACLVVVDEAYGEFRRAGVPSALELLEQYPHLVVSRTMSKAFAMAGLRLGYAAAAEEIVNALQVVRLPYHLSGTTQAVALAALGHSQELLSQVGQLRLARDGLVEWLRAVGLEVIDSDANFVLFGTFVDREQIWQGLLDRGVLIRVVGPSGWLRVSVGTVEENNQFKTALLEVMGR